MAEETPKDKPNQPNIQKPAIPPNNQAKDKMEGFMRREEIGGLIKLVEKITQDVYGVKEELNETKKENEKNTQSIVTAIELGPKDEKDDKDKETAEKKKEEERRNQKFLDKLSKALIGVKNEEGEREGGLFGGIKKMFSKYKKIIFGLLGVGLIALLSQLDMKQLKGLWESLTNAFNQIKKFLTPIVKTVWTWATDTFLPAAVDLFIDGFKIVGELFKNLTKRFSGFTEMSWVERMWALLGAFKDIGVFLVDLTGTLAVSIEKMFGRDGTWITGIWESIKGFFNGIWEWIKLLFTDPSTALDNLVSGSLKNLKAMGKWIMKTLIRPFFAWFETLLDFSSIEKTITSSIDVGLVFFNTIKEFLIDPAVKWVGKKFGWDTSKFTDFSIGELLTKAFKSIVKWFENKFDINFPSLPDWDVGAKVKSMVKALVEKVPERLVPSGILAWLKIPEKKIDTPPPPPMTERFSSWYFTPEGKAAMKKEFGTASPKKSKAKELFESGRWKTDTSSVVTPLVRSGTLGSKIQDHEGFRPTSYPDRRQDGSMGKSIGYGFNLDKKGAANILKAAGITASLEDLKSGKASINKQQAQALMNAELPFFAKKAEEWLGKTNWDKLADNQKMALTDMSYNMGGKFTGDGMWPGLRQAIIDGNKTNMAKEMQDSNYWKQVKGRAMNNLSQLQNPIGTPSQTGVMLSDASGVSGGGQSSGNVNVSNTNVTNAMGDNVLASNGNAYQQKNLEKNAKLNK